MVQAVENNRDYIISSTEIIAYNNGWITREKLHELSGRNVWFYSKAFFKYTGMKEEEKIIRSYKK